MRPLHLPYILIACIFICTGCKKEKQPETSNRPPGSFELLTEPDGRKNADVLPTLTWQRSADPDKDSVSYEVTVETEDGKSSLVIENLTDTFYRFDARLQTNTMYKWSVTAKDGEGGITESKSIFNFTTRELREPQAAAENVLSLSRHAHTSVVFDGKLWVIGGELVTPTETVRLNDIWNSTDGITWQSVSASSAFDSRRHHTSVVFKDNMWVIGGEGREVYADVWYSSNGTNWTQATVMPSGKRYAHSSIVYDNKLWVIGGRNDKNESLNDVWYSENGRNWTQATAQAPFTPRYYSAAAVFDGKMWVIGGNEESTTGSLWYSENGRDWSLATDHPPFGKRYGHSVAVFDNKLWLVGGFYKGQGLASDYKNDIWYSSDGINWTLFVSNTSFKKRMHHTSIVFNNKLWLMFGKSFSATFNEIWSIE